jgi:hypothetical protein
VGQLELTTSSLCLGGEFIDKTLGGFVEKVLEKLETTESTTLAVKRENGGKIRVTSLLWESPSLMPGDEFVDD